MHLKVFLKLKHPKNFLFWANIKKKKNYKTQEKQKTPLGWFFFKPRFFPTLPEGALRAGVLRRHVDGLDVTLEVELPLGFELAEIAGVTMVAGEKDVVGGGAVSCQGGLVACGKCAAAA